jgi:hypothetical protein
MRTGFMRHHAAAPIILKPEYPASSRKLGLGDFPGPGAYHL